ncbi:MAG: methyltransferase domain-containing protein [Planctomycetota bacterium]
MTDARHHPPPPAGALSSSTAVRHAELASVSSRQLVRELVARMRDGGVWTSDDDMAMLGAWLVRAIEKQNDLHHNRFSLQRYHDLFLQYLALQPRPPIRGATIVDAGCGGINPWGFSFLFLALGAARGFAIDLEEIRDQSMAAQALADLAAAMLLDPKRLVGEMAIDPHEVLRNLASFDLARLRAGDPAGVDGSRLAYLREGATAISLPDATADLVFSIAFLEHPADPAAVVREFARITKPGGQGCHVIDLSDHRAYAGGGHPLQFLTEPGPGMAHGSNRLRASEWAALFAASGFEIVQQRVFRTVALPPEVRRALAPPFASMCEADLTTASINLSVRRR